jgi:ethanolamine ammonia-lyase small subunit
MNIKKFTHARVSLPLIGQHALSTHDWLEFSYHQALARDSVQIDFDWKSLSNLLPGEHIFLDSSAENRRQYLLAPERGRVVRQNEKLKIFSSPENLKRYSHLTIIASNGLSSLSCENHFLSFYKILFDRLLPTFKTIPPLIIVNNARVDILDDIGDMTKTDIGIIILGERPGLSSPDSLSVYLSYQPRRGNTNAQKNCVSNIRTSGGLNLEIAVSKIDFLIRESLRKKLSGINLKDFDPNQLSIQDGSTVHDN